MLAGIVSSPAQAGTIGCASVSGDLANRISGSIGCEISGTIGATVGTNTFVNPGANQDFVQGGNSQFANFTVNQEKFFTASNWRFAGKSDGTLSPYFEPDKGSPLKYQGIYDFSDSPLFDLLETATNVMLIFKSGNNTSLVGYLLDNRVNPYQGWWTTPFLNPPFPLGNPASRDVSHISVYYRTGSPLAIPTPALLPGLIALGVGALRKKKQVEQDA